VPSKWRALHPTADTSEAEEGAPSACDFEAVVGCARSEAFAEVETWEDVKDWLDMQIVSKLGEMGAKLDEVILITQQQQNRGIRTSRRGRRNLGSMVGSLITSDTGSEAIPGHMKDSINTGIVSDVGRMSALPEMHRLPPPELTLNDRSCSRSFEENVPRPCASVAVSDVMESKTPTSAEPRSFRSTFTAFTVHRMAPARISTVLATLDFQARLTSKSRSRKAKYIWQFLEEPESSRLAFYYAAAMPWLIVFSVLLTTLQTGTPPLLTGLLAWIMELIVDSIFSAEILLRWWASPKRVRFLFSSINLVDLVPIVCLPMRLYLGRFKGMDLTIADVTYEEKVFGTFLLCIVPILRLLKLLRRFEKFLLLLHAFEVALEALPVLLFTGCIIMLAASSLIFFCEPNSNVDSLPRAMWFVMVTMSTVGYGDISPKSTAGSIATAVLFITSALYMAIPLGIVGNAFNRVWEDRDRLLLLRRTRKRLAQWGYTAMDIMNFFTAFSTHGGGVLTLDDFGRMIEEMSLGLTERRINDLFELFDDDGSGTIEPEEFVAILYGGR